MYCHYCKRFCIKKGKQKNGTQKYFCKCCHKYQQEEYLNNACKQVTEKMIVKLCCNGSGIRDIARVLEISATTVINKLKAIAGKISLPDRFYKGKKYEVDELKTYIGRKENEHWVCCGLEKENKEILSLSVGKRTKRTLKRALTPLLLSEPKRIYTDKLKHYGTLIDKSVHRFRLHAINRIERKFLSLRTHVKRLCRKTICYSKKAFMLEAHLKIYLWYEKIMVL